MQQARSLGLFTALSSDVFYPSVRAAQSAASIKIRFACRGTVDQIERAAQNLTSFGFGIRGAAETLGESAQTPSLQFSLAPASRSVLALNRMSSMNPLMTISFDDISPLPIRLVVIFLLHVHKFGAFW